MTEWRTIRGRVSGTVAFVLCPCHLVITLPLIVTATAGTAFGAWLEGNKVAFVAIVTVAFIGGVLLTVKWVRQNASAEASCSFESSKAKGSADSGRHGTTHYPVKDPA